MIRKMFLYLFLALLLALSGTFIYVFMQEPKMLDANARKKIGGSFIELSKGFVHYELKGPDTGKVVILIHGAGSGSYAWDNNYNFLVNKGFRVLRYDLYGRGFSDRPEVTYDTTLFLEQLSELIQRTHLKPPYSLVSVSMGSSVSIPFACRNTEKIKKLVVVDPASLGDGNIAWYLNKPFISPLLMSVYWYPRAVDKQMKEFYNPAKVPEYRKKSLAQMHYKGLKRAMLSSWQNMLTVNLKSHLDLLGNTKVKVLLVWGKYDPLIHPSVSKHYMASLPGSELIEIDKAGHLSNYERPDVFNEKLKSFLLEK